jgi:hypothetical protein
MKKKISFVGSKWYKNTRPILPFKLDGKWYLWKKIRTTYIVQENGESIPIKVELRSDLDN